MTNICNDDYNDDGDYIPDRVTADDDDHNVDAHSGDQNLALSYQFLNERKEIGYSARENYDDVESCYVVANKLESNQQCCQLSTVSLMSFPVLD